MNIEESLREALATAAKEEKKGLKHKGLLITKPDLDEAKEYIKKAKESLELCNYYKQKGLDYKIPEEWFYSFYYCASAILAIFGVQSRSQKYTALFLKYIQEKGLINYDGEFVERIMVYREKEKESDVDKREEARYGSWIKSEEVMEKYDQMMNSCKKAIDETEEIVFSSKPFNIPKELIN
jgi:uncharacterized protein (UPF0332 family)